MGQLSVKAKKAAYKIKHLIKAGRHERPNPVETVQSKASPSACSAHRVKGCRCDDLTKYVFAEAKAINDTPPTLSGRTASTVSLCSIALEGMEPLGRCKSWKDDGTAYDDDDDDNDDDDAFLLGKPEQLTSTPNTANQSPVRRLPKLDFLERALAQCNEGQSGGVALKDGEEWALAPEEVGPANFTYELSYGENYVAAPHVERRRSL